MSFNTENRNSLTTTTIPSTMSHRLRGIAQNRVRCCSFCQEQGHTINVCNDTRIHNFEVECINTKNLLEMTYVSNESVNMFKQWLSDKYLESPILVKTFAIRKCSCGVRSNVQQCFDAITNYIFYIYQDDYDFIPFANPNDDGLLAAEAILMLAGYSNENIQEILRNTVNKLSQIMRPNISTVIEELEDKDKFVKCECSICLENYENVKFVKLNCVHTFCNECVIETIKRTNGNTVKCALCRSEIKTIVSYTNGVKNKIDAAL